nr:hypothetical protein [Micromonospora sp. DSM 115978]
VAARPFGMLIGFAGHHAFTHRPSFRALAHLSPAERALELVKPAVKQCILAEPDLPADPGKQFDGMKDVVALSLGRIYAMGDPPDYEPAQERTVAAIAEQRGVSGLEALYDLMLASATGPGSATGPATGPDAVTGADGPATAMLLFPFFNYSDANHD